MEPRTDSRAEPRSALPISLGVLVVVLAVAGATCGGAATRPALDAPRTHRLTILHTNDHHGHAWPETYRGCEGVGGLAAQATLVRLIRQEVERGGGPESGAGGVLLLMAGDLNTGVPESDLFAARPDLEAMERAGYDALVCGNHEFDGTADRWEAQLALARFPVLCANVRRRSDGTVAGRTHVTIESAGLRVALVGVVTDQALSSGMPGIWSEAYRLEDPIEVATRIADAVRADHDLVIGLVHLGLYPTGPRSESGSLALARRTDAFDVIVDGHTHSLLDVPVRVGRTLVVQAGEHGAYLGRLDLTVASSVGEPGSIVDHRYALLPVNAPPPGGDACPAADERLPEAPDVAALLAAYRAQVADRLVEPVGVVDSALEGGGHVARRGETALGNLVADALRWVTGADIGVVNGGGLRASLGPGPVTWGDLLRVAPFDDHVVRLRVRGAVLQAALDRSAAAHPNDGGFLQVSGLRFAIRGGRAVGVTIQGEPIVPAREYVIATTDYLAAGGDGYEVLAGIAIMDDTGLHYAEALRRYIAHHRTVRPIVEGRIVRDGAAGAAGGERAEGAGDGAAGGVTPR